MGQTPLVNRLQFDIDKILLCKILSVKMFKNKTNQADFLAQPLFQQFYQILSELLTYPLNLVFRCPKNLIIRIAGIFIGGKFQNFLIKMLLYKNYLV